MNTKSQQRYLAMLGLYRSPIDGIDGPKTQNAISEFCQYRGIQPAEFTDQLMSYIRKLPVQSYEGRGGTALANVIQALCTAMFHPQPEVWAYIMATVEHETKASYYPVVEAYWLDDSQRKRYLTSKRYHPYYGRGLVQLTWDYNYKKYSEILGIDLVADPDKALDPQISLFVLVHGMLTGTFTGRSVSRYINNSRIDYKNARRVVNGTDCDDEIAQLAQKWQIHYETAAKRVTA